VEVGPVSALVVYESMFGNTRDVARAVREGIAPLMPVELVEVASAPREIGAGVDLLVVGAPTHAFSLSRPGTREDAARQAAGPLVSSGIGAREWLEQLRQLPGGLRYATFDTRVARPRLPGSAARAADKRLRHLGGAQVARPASFWVEGTKGPLAGDQLTTARDWGAGVARQALAHPATVGRARG
jgi:hypothetical protein